MKKIVLLGGGGHCASVADALLRTGEYDVVGIVDKTKGRDLFGCIPFLGTDDDLPRLYAEGFHYAFITVGSAGNTALREKLCLLTKEIGFSLPNMIDPSAVVSAYCTLGSGVFVGKNAVVNASAAVGDCAIVNTASVIEHDCTVGPFAHISPCATLCGDVKIGFGTHVGAGTVIKQGVTVGAHTVIGMGSVVTGDISAGVVAYGNPCREVRKI